MSDREALFSAPDCVGGFRCPADKHLHGCLNDNGNCDRPEEHKQALFSDRSLRDAWIAGFENAAGHGIWNARFDGLRIDIFEAADQYVDQEARVTTRLVSLDEWRASRA